MKKLYKYLIFLTINLHVTSSKINCMNNQNNSQTQPSTEKKVPHPYSLINPKTGKPYTCKTEAWSAFWDIFYVWCQKKEDEKNKLIIEKQKIIEEFKNNIQKSFGHKENNDSKL